MKPLVQETDEKTKESERKRKKSEEKAEEKRRKKIESYFKCQDRKDKYHNFFSSTVFFDLINFIVTGVLVALIIESSESQTILDNFPSQFLYLLISLTFLSIAAGIIFYFRHKATRKKLEEFKNINEIMNSSFQIIFNFFIDNMMLIRESLNKQKITNYLKLFAEKQFFMKLAETLSDFLANLFPSEIEIKIDIFKFEDNKLKPIMDTFINGAFREGIKSALFEIPDKKVHFDSLAAFSFCRNKIGYIRYMEKTQNMLDSLRDDIYKLKIRSERNLYFEKHEATEGFVLGTILCFPLIWNGSKFGVLSIGFKEQNIERYLTHLGITIEDFKRCISTFIKKYTKFVIFTSQGFDNLIERYH